jgi:hypothetical protein
MERSSGEEKMKRLAVIVLLACAASGCAHVAQYRTEYVTGQIRHFTPSIDGEALVVTEPAQDEKLYSGHPSSFTGMTTTFEATVGRFLRETMVKVLSYKFTGGAKHAHELPQGTGTYRVVVKPKIVNFDYRYNQLKNLGFAITPEAKVELQVSVFDREGSTLLEKRYESDFVSGGAYVADFQPGEKINRAVHRALVEVTNQVAEDIEQALRTQMPSS